ncbi:hypothetical protein NAEGRDRAFT_80777 [Naegleria gruberi]|uniref:F-box domain-containing protein n=1 Tax=Naegleria gruberi TaxID=5762 RepID=D2VPN9_NAEGR|nr:uncharacterized protein NAEGRDRAFT_80777 [Naegleria gruberi]EFC41159.1 hypothetical protein NAEGRDRAFT_80777 [Naegleria gruberi]|eukprot:XP_002673903.1 hypothetical protein NAEGRDRAFT_80777 [Naegleria gruberi strain NEG-M]
MKQLLLCQDILSLIIMFDEDPFEILMSFRSVCKTWHEWTNSHHLLLDCIISVLHKGWSIRNDSTNETFQVNLFKLPSYQDEYHPDIFTHALKYYKLVKKHIEQYTEQLEHPNSSCEYVYAPTRVENKLALEMSSILTPFLFLKKASTEFGSYDFRSNLATVVIANVKGEDKFVSLKMLNDRGQPGPYSNYTVCELLEFETDSSKIQSNDELLNVLINHLGTTKSWNRKRVLEVMEFIGLEEEFLSNNDCVNDFIYVVMYELIFKSIEIWYTEQYLFNCGDI